MKYLTIFESDNFTAANSFASRKAAADYINNCAKAANARALENNENGNFIIESKGDNKCLFTVKIEPVDTEVKFELTTNNGSEAETTYYNTRKALVDKVHKTLDGYDFDASVEEDNTGEWAVRSSNRNLNVALSAKLVVMAAEDTVVSSYQSCDMLGFCKNITASLAKLSQDNTILTADQLKAGRKKGIVNLAIGAGIAILGGLMSYASYSNARPGEKYTIYTGLIVIGVVDAVCGLYYLINPKATLPKNKKK